MNAKSWIKRTLSQLTLLIWRVWFQGCLYIQGTKSPETSKEFCMCQCCVNLWLVFPDRTRAIWSKDWGNTITACQMVVGLSHFQGCKCLSVYFFFDHFLLYMKTFHNRCNSAFVFHLHRRYDLDCLLLLVRRNETQTPSQPSTLPFLLQLRWWKINAGYWSEPPRLPSFRLWQAVRGGGSSSRGFSTVEQLSDKEPDSGRPSTRPIPTTAVSSQVHTWERGRTERKKTAQKLLPNTTWISTTF